MIITISPSASSAKNGVFTGEYFQSQGTDSCDCPATGDKGDQFKLKGYLYFQKEQEEGEAEGKGYKEGKEEKEGKVWREWVLEGLEVTGDPLVPTRPRDLHPPHPRPRPHRRLHLLCYILLLQ